MGTGASKTNNETTASAPPRRQSQPQPLQQQRRQSKLVPTTPPPVSAASFEVFIRTLQRLPFTLTEEQFETIIYDLAEHDFPPHEVILKGGEPASGLYVFVSGSCDVVASDGITVLRRLHVGDFVGEISSLYKTVCSCTVVCGEETDCRAVFLPITKIQSLFEHGAGSVVPLKEWFTSQKYIDTNDTFRNLEICEMLVKEGMSQSPLFHGWSDAAIASVYSTLLPIPVELYEPSCIIFFPEDQTSNGYLLVDGTMEIFSDNNSLIVDAREEYFWFGDEQLFSDNPKMVSARAKTPCQVVVFTSDSLAQVFNKFKHESDQLTTVNAYWQKYFRVRDPQLYERHFSVINVMWIQHVLRESDIFARCRWSSLYLIALSTVLRDFRRDEVVLTHDADSEPLLCVVLQGGCVVLRPAEDSEDQHLYPGDVFYFNHTYEEKSHVKGLEDSVVGLVSRAVLEEVKGVYPDTLITVDWDESV